MTDYTAEDFIDGSFAVNGSRIAMWSYDHIGWLASDGNVYSSAEMAEAGWTPIQEEPKTKLSLDTMKDAWNAAEIITEDNLPNKNDTIIFRRNEEDWSIFVSVHNWVNPANQWYRILQRKKRPEGAEKIEGVLRSLQDEEMSLAEIADALAESLKAMNDE